MYTVQIAQAVNNYIRTAVYKCDRPSAENACETLMKLALDSEDVRRYIYNEMVLVIAEYGIYMNTTESMAKIYLVQILQKVLQTC